MSTEAQPDLNPKPRDFLRSAVALGLIVGASSFMFGCGERDNADGDSASTAVFEKSRVLDAPARTISLAGSRGDMSLLVKENYPLTTANSPILANKLAKMAFMQAKDQFLNGTPGAVELPYIEQPPGEGNRTPITYDDTSPLVHQHMNGDRNPATP